MAVGVLKVIMSSLKNSFNRIYFLEQFQIYRKIENIVQRVPICLAPSVPYNEHLINILFSTFVIINEPTKLELSLLVNGLVY